MVFSSPENLQEKELPLLHKVTRCALAWRRGGLGLGGAVGQKGVGKQVAHCFGRQTAAKRWFSSLVRAEAKSLEGWQGHDLRAGVQEDLHGEL